MHRSTVLAGNEAVVDIYMYVNIYVFMCICIYVYMFICIYVYI